MGSFVLTAFSFVGMLQVSGRKMEFTFDRLQAEQAEWSLKNFGAHEPWRPLMGICEELGELAEALYNEDDANTLDSIADTVVFAADLCTCMGWSLSDIAGLMAPPSPSPDDRVGGHLLYRIGKIQHHYLKRVQAIRINEDHIEGMMLHLAGIFSILRDLSGRYNKTLLEVTGPVWFVVRQRDWTKNKVDATSQPV